MSSDEDKDGEIPLCERVQLNRAGAKYESVRSKNGSPKQFRGSQKKSQPRSAQWKRYQEWRSKACPGDQWLLPETPSPYFLGSKKRQNGDKNEQIAKSKRTCLSDRLMPTEWGSVKKKNGIIDHLCRSHSESGLKIAAPSGGKTDSTDRGQNEAECSFNFDSHNSSANETGDQNSENSIPLSSTDGPSSSLGSSSGVSSEKPLTFRDVGRQMISFDPLSQPSTSKFGQPAIESENNNVHKPCTNRGVRFLDSDDDDDDDDTRSSLNSTALKGGRELPDGIAPVRKVIGRGCRKILDSDDSSDDWQSQYRRPSHCLSSDSDDSSDFPIKPRRRQFPKSSLSRLSSTDSNDESASSMPLHSRNGTVSKQCNSSSSHEATNDCSFHPNNFLGEHSYASAETASTSAADNVSTSVQNPSSHGTGSSPMIGRNRFSRHKGSARRSISPHPRLLSTRRYSGLSRMGSGQFRQDAKHRNLASQFPDLFDAEDSSEVEFFTANSYSDTETSGESVGGMEAGGSGRNFSSRRNNSTVVLSASSEDEISVIFSGSTPCAEMHNRRGRPRGSALRRRRVRGSGRSSVCNQQEVGSGSPDPVEQVRQVEEDERFARMLQAEFDAEANEAPMFLNSTESDTDSAVMDPFGSLGPDAFSSRRERSFSPFNSASPVRSGEGTESVPLVPQMDHANLFSSLSSSHRIRGRPRIGISSNVVTLTSPGSRRRRGRRNFQVHHGDPWMWQFARVLGLGPTPNHLYEQEEGDYEALLHLAETVGEVIPRGLRKTEINRLPTRKYFFPSSGASTSQGYEEIVHKRTELNKECQVCLSDYENGDLLRILPCFHEFHTPCIDPWLKINHTCPVCRVEVSFDD